MFCEETSSLSADSTRLDFTVISLAESSLPSTQLTLRVRAFTLLRMFGVPDRLACLAEPNRCVSESSVKKQIFLDFEEIFLSRQCILQGLGSPE